MCFVIIFWIKNTLVLFFKTFLAYLVQPQSTLACLHRHWCLLRHPDRMILYIVFVQSFLALPLFLFVLFLFDYLDVRLRGRMWVWPIGSISDWDVLSGAIWPGQADLFRSLKYKCRAPDFLLSRVDFCIELELFPGDTWLGFSALESAFLCA